MRDHIKLKTFELADEIKISRDRESARSLNTGIAKMLNTFSLSNLNSYRISNFRFHTFGFLFLE